MYTHHERMITLLDTNVRCFVCASNPTPGELQLAFSAGVSPGVRRLRIGDRLALPETSDEIILHHYFKVRCGTKPRKRLVLLEPWICPRGCDDPVRRNAIRVVFEHEKLTERCPVAFEASEVRLADFVKAEFTLWHALIPMLLRHDKDLDEDEAAGWSVRDIFNCICM